MNETTTPDRVAIRAELRRTQAEYKELVGQVGDAGWKRRSGISAWTCGQLAWHIAAGVGFQAGQIDGAMQGKALNPPAFLLPLLYKASELRVRIASRNATPTSVLADFDAGMARVLAVLDAADDQTLTITATALGETHTVGEMFHLPTQHFTEHAGDIRRGLGAT